jgi:hypothetical protein
MASENVTVPRTLLSTVLDAFDLLDADTRRDRVLKDETIKAVDETRARVDAWLREKAGL